MTMKAQECEELPILAELGRCRQWIEDALKYTKGTHDFDDIVDAVLKGEMQLWPGRNSALITSINTTPKKLMLSVFLTGGEMDELVEMCSQAEEWGKRQGCSMVISTGRLGWERVMKKHGWKKTHVTISKEL